jgi:dynein intermediate chain 1
MPPRGKTKKGKKSKKQVEEEMSDNLQEDDEMFNVENAALAGDEQEDLTQEEKDEVHLKQLTTKNPQAPTNITTFSFADRQFKLNDQVEQIVFHYSVDGDIIMKDTPEAND